MKSASGDFHSVHHSVMKKLAAFIFHSIMKKLQAAICDTDMKKLAAEIFHSVMKKLGAVILHSVMKKLAAVILPAILFMSEWKKFNFEVSCYNDAFRNEKKYLILKCSSVERLFLDFLNAQEIGRFFHESFVAAIIRRNYVWIKHSSLPHDRCINFYPFFMSASSILQDYVQLVQLFLRCA